MFFGLMPEFAGCNSKLTFHETSRFQEIVFPHQSPQASDFFASNFEDRTIVFSIDKIGRFCSDLGLFSSAALNHAFRDVVSGFAFPHSADICFEFGNDLGSIEARELLVTAVRDACAGSGVTVGKCHSILSGSTALTIAARGAKLREGVLGESRLSNGVVLLTHQLGAFREIYLNEMGHERSMRSTAESLVRRSYKCVSELKSLGAHVLSDVSGFGLAGTLAGLANSNMISMNIALSRDALIDPALAEESLSCLMSDCPSNVSVMDGSKALENAVCLRELAGPLVILCSPESVSAVSTYLSERELGLTLDIGTFSSGACDVKVRWA